MVGAQAPSRVFVVVFDDQQLSSGALKRLQAAAVTLFTDAFQPGDLGGVVVDGQLVNNRLLSERAELLKAVERALLGWRPLPISRHGGVPGNQPWRGSPGSNARRSRGAASVSASVQSLLAGLGRVGGPKAVLLASGGFGGDAESPRIVALADAAKRAGVRFYVFDESGNDRDAAGGLARSTGGMTVHRSGDFAAAIARVAADGHQAFPGAYGENLTLEGLDWGALAATSRRALDGAPRLCPITCDHGRRASAVPVCAARPLTEAGLMTLAGGDWSEAGARAGWEAYQRGDLESARTALAPIAARSTSPSWVRYVLGQADYALGKFKEAAEAWERVRARQPQFQPVYLDLADDYVKLNERDKSLEVLRAGRQRWPKDADVLNALGVIEAGGGKLDDAIKGVSRRDRGGAERDDHYLNLAKALEMVYMRKRRN
jgi:tetratricopeptide (TPR) repeat protein